MMLHKLKELILSTRSARRQCEACGQTFRCGTPLKGCWCSQIELSPESLERIRQRYKNCLCPACLPQFNEGELLNINQFHDIDQ